MPMEDPEDEAVPIEDLEEEAVPMDIVDDMLPVPAEPEDCIVVLEVRFMKGAEEDMEEEVDIAVPMDGTVEVARTTLR